MMKKTFLSAIGLLLSCTGAMAQLHESVSVEGEYVPDIIRIDKIYSFPSHERTGMKVTPLGFEEEGVVADYNPFITTMPATEWRASRILPSTRGYLDFGVGSWLNSELSAGYRIVDRGPWRLGARFQHCSTSLWKPNTAEECPWLKRFRYDETLGLDLSRDFGSAGCLSASAQYHFGYFNYYSDARFSESKGEFLFPTQTVNDFLVNVGWDGARSEEYSPVWNAVVSARYFGYRNFYNTYASPFWNERMKGDRETHIRLKGAYRFPWESGSSLGADASLDMLFYEDCVREDLLSSPGNYGKFTVTPYYRFTRGGFNVKLGVAVDVTVNARDRQADERYSLFHFAPDVRADYNAGPVGMWLHVTGGSRLHTLAGQAAKEYYQFPVLVSTMPEYTPLDARLGLSFGPFSGFSASAEAAYAVRRNVRFEGWYSYFLDSDENNIESYLCGIYPSGLHGARFMLKAAYTLGAPFTLEASGAFMPQKGDWGWIGDGDFDRPRFKADFSVKTTPWRSLTFRLDYSLKGKRALYRMEKVYPVPGVAVDGPEEILTAAKLPNLSQLDFSVSYDFTPRFGVWIQADNLLCRRNMITLGLPTERLTVAGGLKILF